MGDKPVVERGQPPDLPAPPEIQRRVLINPTQAIGVPILALVPFAGLLGLLDTKMEEASATQGDLALSVTYPSRIRDRTHEPMVLQVKNNGTGELRDVRLLLSRSAVEGFEEVSAHPEASEMDHQGLVFRFDRISAGQTRSVEVELKTGVPWAKEGEVRASAEGESEVAIPLKIFVLP